MRLESNFVEYKVILNGKLEKVAVALVNRFGGIFYIGVADDRTIKGVKNIDRVIKNVEKRLRNNIEPSIDGLYSINKIGYHDKKEIIRIAFSAGNQKPYYIKSEGLTPKGCYIRIADNCVPMSEKLISRFVELYSGGSEQDR
ncbi:MAG: ATP-binding protein [Clostridia bacterium]|nr:ATP-binding protein [Clostridia bacterium]